MKWYLIYIITIEMDIGSLKKKIGDQTIVESLRKDIINKGRRYEDIKRSYDINNESMFKPLTTLHRSMEKGAIDRHNQLIASLNQRLGPQPYVYPNFSSMRRMPSYDDDDDGSTGSTEYPDIYPSMHSPIVSEPSSGSDSSSEHSQHTIYGEPIARHDLWDPYDEIKRRTWSTNRAYRTESPEVQLDDGEPPDASNVSEPYQYSVTWNPPQAKYVPYEPSTHHLIDEPVVEPSSRTIYYQVPTLRDIASRKVVRKPTKDVGIQNVMKVRTKEKGIQNLMKVPTKEKRIQNVAVLTSKGIQNVPVVTETGIQNVPVVTETGIQNIMKVPTKEKGIQNVPILTETGIQNVPVVTKPPFVTMADLQNALTIVNANKSKRKEELYDDFSNKLDLLNQVRDTSSKIKDASDRIQALGTKRKTAKVVEPTKAKAKAKEVPKAVVLTSNEFSKHELDLIGRLDLLNPVNAVKEGKYYDMIEKSKQMAKKMSYKTILDKIKVRLEDDALGNLRKFQTFMKRYRDELLSLKDRKEFPLNRYKDDDSMFTFDGKIINALGLDPSLSNLPTKAQLELVKRNMFGRIDFKTDDERHYVMEVLDIYEHAIDERLNYKPPYNVKDDVFMMKQGKFDDTMLNPEGRILLVLKLDPTFNKMPSKEDLSYARKYINDMDDKDDEEYALMVLQGYEKALKNPKKNAKKYLLTSPFIKNILKGSGIHGKQPKRNAYKIKSNGEYGVLMINKAKMLNNMVLEASINGKVVYSVNCDRDLIDLLTKRFNPKKRYSQKAIMIFNDLNTLSNLPKHRTSGKTKLIGGNVYYTQPSQMVQRLKVLTGSRRSGNNSIPVYNEIVQLLDRLLEINAISRTYYDTYMKRFM